MTPPEVCRTRSTFVRRRLARQCARPRARPARCTAEVCRTHYPAGVRACQHRRDPNRRTSMSPPGPRPGSRSLVLVALACSLVGRSLDAFPHPDHRYLPFVWALFLLPGWYASGRLRGAWHRYRWQLLAVQAVLTVVPFALFGQHWVAGVSGLFAGLVLVLLPGRVAWPAYGALAILEVVLWTTVGLPYEPRGAAITWLLVAFVNQSLILFGLTRLADIVEGLDANRYALARAEGAGQRLTA